MSGLFDLASSFLRQTKGTDGQPLSSNQRPIPSLKQLMPGASRNFGFQQGEGGFTNLTRNECLSVNMDELDRGYNLDR